MLHLLRQTISHFPKGRARMARNLARLTPGIATIKMVGSLTGCQMRLDFRDCFQAAMACSAYQPDLINVLRNLVRSDDIILTGGSHIGYLMLHLASFARDGLVIGFEADPLLPDKKWG